MAVDEHWVQAQIRRKQQYDKDVAKLQQIGELPEPDPLAWITKGNVLMQKAKLFQEIADITHDPVTVCQAALADAEVKLWKWETNHQLERSEIAIKYSKYNKFQPDEE